MNRIVRVTVAWCELLTKSTRIGLLLLIAFFLLMAACSADASDEALPGVGPMAVMVDDATGASEASAGTGTVDISDACVTFTNERGKVLLLVWRSAEVAWDEEERTITFTPRSDTEERVTLAHGDTIVVGGESFASDDDLERNVSWRARPHARCPSTWFIVNSVVRP